MFCGILVEEYLYIRPSMTSGSPTIHVVLMICGLALWAPLGVFAATDGVYMISVDSVGFAGGQTSTDGTYGVTDTLGEPIVGVSTDGMYQLQDGVWYPESAATTMMTLTLSAATTDLGTLIAGTPNTGTITTTVTTNAPNGYQLFINQDHDLTHTDDGTTVIPAFSAGTIAIPSMWGTNVGLGVSLLTATDKAVKWGVSPNETYAAIPTIATLLHAVTGYHDLPNDTVMQYKTDVAQSQKAGMYANTVTYTAMESL